MQLWFLFAYIEAKCFPEWGGRMAIGSERRIQNLIAACLTAGQASGVFRSTDPIITASLIQPLLQDWYVERGKYRRNDVSPDDYASWVIGFIEAFTVEASELLPRAETVELTG